MKNIIIKIREEGKSFKDVFITFKILNISNHSQKMIKKENVMKKIYKRIKE